LFHHGKDIFRHFRHLLAEPEVKAEARRAGLSHLRHDTLR